MFSQCQILFLYRRFFKPPPSSVSRVLQCQNATQDEDHDWQSGKLRRPVTHLPISVSEGYFLLAFPPLPPPPPSSSLPESSPCYLLNGLVTAPPAPCSSLQDPQKSQERKARLLRQTPAPLQGGLACLLTPVEWVVSRGSQRERSAVQHASSRRSSERTSHAFPFGADSTGAVDRCLPGGHAALPGGVGPLRRVQVPGLLRWRPDLGLHGLPTRGSRHDPVPEGYPGSPKCHMRRPSRDVLCPGEYKWIPLPKMCPRNKQTNTAAFCLSCIFWQTPSKPLWPRKCLRLKT